MSRLCTQRLHGITRCGHPFLAVPKGGRVCTTQLYGRPPVSVRISAAFHSSLLCNFSHATSTAIEKMQQNIKPAVITVGDELVLGEREHNNNEKFMIQLLKSRGAAPRLCVQVGDRIDDISDLISYLKDKDYWPIFIAGGLGATHDDLTREGVASGLGVRSVNNEECFAILSKKYKTTPERFNEQRQRMAILPEGCKLIGNPVGAPGFSIQGVYAYPGFPRMMNPMMTETINSLFPDAVDFITYDLYLETVEATVALEVEEFSKRWHGIGSIGIYPSNMNYSKMVKLRLRYPSSETGVRDDFDAMVRDIEARLGLAAKEVVR
eukprot:CFRG2358T1